MLILTIAPTAKGEYTVKRNIFVEMGTNWVMASVLLV